MSKGKTVGFIGLAIMVRPAMIAACVSVAVAALSAANAQSTERRIDCDALISTKIPLKLTYQNGFTMTVLERNGPELRSEIFSSKGNKVTTAVTYGGLFTLRRLTPRGEVIDYKWDRDVTQFFPLKVGEHITAAVTMSVNNQVLNSMSTEHTVVANESYRIGACDYPVLKIEFHNHLAEAPKEGDGVRYYHAASMLVLKSVSKVSATPWLPEHTAEERVERLE